MHERVTHTQKTNTHAYHINMYLFTHALHVSLGALTRSYIVQTQIRSALMITPELTELPMYTIILRTRFNLRSHLRPHLRPLSMSLLVHFRFRFYCPPGIYFYSCHTTIASSIESIKYLSQAIFKWLRTPFLRGQTAPGYIAKNHVCG